ncbi:hypothetical protein AMECASPLE_015406 [Ameca splendens]|uniref:C2 domain-containing protein n=1 Tax=Ameca splendens TaxID=208324 RepID=A0ABV0YDT4_9TELE
MGSQSQACTFNQSGFFQLKMGFSQDLFLILSFHCVMASKLSVLLLVLCTLSLAHAQLRLFNLRASNLPANLFGTTDGYVSVLCGATNLGKTSVRTNTANPWWEEEFTHFQALENDVLKLEVHDHDILFDDLLGVCQRQLQFGTYQHDCYLEKGGTLHYSYTLG